MVTICLLVLIYRKNNVILDIDNYYDKENVMSKTCPSCNREVENEIVFCNFCGAFAGNKMENPICSFRSSL